VTPCATSHDRSGAERVPLDPRLHAYRPDLADARLADKISAMRYAQGRPHTVTAALIDVRSAPRDDATQTTQALMGEAAMVFEIEGDWAWCQLSRDGYVGYVPAAALAEGIREATHEVAVPSTFVYPDANLKTAPYTAIYMCTPLAVVEEGEKWSRIADGRYVFTRHLRPFGTGSGEPVAVAQLFEHVPYLWGGRTLLGVDCSGLVQTAFQACGRWCPRDTDMMEGELGTALPFGDPAVLQRGDLVFWKGHMGMMVDGERLIHANGHHMLTVIEPLSDALTRIAALFGPATSFRRP
jgi:cell wall-associated NlpC family hydrolase